MHPTVRSVSRFCGSKAKQLSITSCQTLCDWSHDARGTKRKRRGPIIRLARWRNGKGSRDYGLDKEREGGRQLAETRRGRSTQRDTEICIATVTQSVYKDIKEANIRWINDSLLKYVTTAKLKIKAVRFLVTKLHSPIYNLFRFSPQRCLLKLSYFKPLNCIIKSAVTINPIQLSNLFLIMNKQWV